MKALKLAIVAIFFSLGPIQTYADQTNLVQNLRIQLWGVSQGGSFSNAIVTTTAANFAVVDTRGVITALGAATANTFSSASRLVVVTPLAGGSPSYQVRDGMNTVDVTGFFVAQQQGGSVQSSVVNNRSGRSSTTVYSIQELILQDSNGYAALNLHFDAAGYAVETTRNQLSDLTISASGTGDRNGNLLILQGTIEVSGGTLEVVPGGPGLAT
jgi:hypothetical protein